mmetsp:Transcript_50155/g.133709  ORF Transcript_50155/g.133709 Transcript_50155/m.133709 type:complete len:238 (-) Transcript_50155:433-1146(-)
MYFTSRSPCCTTHSHARSSYIASSLSCGENSTHSTPSASRCLFRAFTKARSFWRPDESSLSICRFAPVRHMNSFIFFFFAPGSLEEVHLSTKLSPFAAVVLLGDVQLARLPSRSSSSGVSTALGTLGSTGTTQSSASLGLSAMGDRGPSVARPTTMLCWAFLALPLSADVHVLVGRPPLGRSELRAASLNRSAISLARSCGPSGASTKWSTKVQPFLYLSLSCPPSMPSRPVSWSTQ